MKPRQTADNYHNSNVPPYSRNQNQAMPPTTQLSDHDLAKLGLSRDELLAHLQAVPANNNPNPSNLSNQEEILKCLQAFYGKSSAEVLQNWSLNQQQQQQQQQIQPPPISPPNYSRIPRSGGPGGSGSSFAHNSSGSAASNNNNISGLQKHDIHFANSNAHSHQQQQLPANVNHFRASTSNLQLVQQMQQQHHHQQQPQLSQQKSVLSLHQQHHQHNDNLSTSNRRLNQAHHHMGNSNATANASFANLTTNTAAAIAAAAAAAASSSASSLTLSNNDANATNLTALAGVNCGSSSGGVGASGSSSSNKVAHVGGNIMDTFNSIDMFYDNSLQLGKDQLAANQQQTLIRQLLKNTGGGTGGSSQPNHHNLLNPTTSPSPSSLHTQLSKIQDNNNHQSMRNINSHNNNNNNNNNNMLPPQQSQLLSTTANHHHHHQQQSHHQITSPAAAMSPPSQPAASFSSVPKSLLNLAAACSSTSTPSSANTSSLGNVSSKIASLNHLNMLASQHRTGLVSGNPHPIPSGSQPVSHGARLSSASTSRNSSSGTGDISILKQTTPNSNGPQSFSSQQQQMGKLNNGNNNNNNNSNSNALKQLQMSLLATADQNNADQQALLAYRGNLKSQLASQGPNSKQQHSSQSQSQLQSRQDAPSTKDNFISSLQERAAKAGISIGEISKSLKSVPAGASLMSNNNLVPTSSSQVQQIGSTSTANSLQPQSHLISSKEDQLDRSEIESALSRVEARNDLSLLYPPILLASNSQKQVNALSAGISDAVDSDRFTDEVRRIVLEECNIIYECKECNNLFRSLSNLIRHKRTFCSEHEKSRGNSLENTKRLQLNSIFQVDQQNTSTAATGRLSSDLGSQQPPQSLETEAMQMSDPQIDLVRSSINLNPSLSLIPEGQTSTSDINNFTRQQQMLASETRISRLTKSGDKRDHGYLMTKSRYMTSNSGHLTATATSAANPAPTQQQQTSLSRLLQSQPKQSNRVPSSNKDSALLGALKMGSTPNTTVDSLNAHLQQVNQLVGIGGGSLYNSFDNNNDKNNINASSAAANNNYPFNDVNEQLVRSSSLAKTLLNEKVRTGGPNVAQSLIELTRSETGQQQQLLSQQQAGSSTGKRVANPKRKFLEDCIKKVKRDKLFTEDDSQNNADQTAGVNEEMPGEGHRGTATAMTTKAASSQCESDADSDMLMIDLDGSQTRSSRSQRRGSTAASSTASSSNSSLTSRFNTSSALLKALTRPVDNNNKGSSKLYTGQAVDDDCQLVDPTRDDTDKVLEPETESRRPNDEHQESKEAKEVVNEIQEEVLSPLFDTYTCDICDISYKDLKTLMGHTFSVHEEEKTVFPCLFCSLSFVALENVCRHIIDIHKKPRAQIHRLSEVVLSRSHVSSDFQTCSDYSLCADLVAESQINVGLDKIIDTKDEASDQQDSSQKTDVTDVGLAIDESQQESLTQDEDGADRPCENLVEEYESAQETTERSHRDDDEMAEMQVDEEDMREHHNEPQVQSDDDNNVDEQDVDQDAEDHDGDDDDGDGDDDENGSIDLADHEHVAVKDPWRTAGSAGGGKGPRESQATDHQNDDEDPYHSDSESVSSRSSSGSSSSSNSRSSSGSSSSSSSGSSSGSSSSGSDGSSSSGSSSRSSSSDSSKDDGASDDAQKEHSKEKKRLAKRNTGGGDTLTPDAKLTPRNIERRTPVVQTVDADVDLLTGDSTAIESPANRPPPGSSSHRSTSSQGSTKALAANKTKLDKVGKISESTSPSTSGTAAGSGASSTGLIKLKIQLKTRPDEKSKVYEIV